MSKFKIHDRSTRWFRIHVKRKVSGLPRGDIGWDAEIDYDTFFNKSLFMILGAVTVSVRFAHLIHVARIIRHFVYMIRVHHFFRRVFVIRRFRKSMHIAGLLPQEILRKNVNKNSSEQNHKYRYEFFFPAENLVLGIFLVYFCVGRNSRNALAFSKPPPPKRYNPYKH